MKNWLCIAGMLLFYFGIVCCSSSKSIEYSAGEGQRSGRWISSQAVPKMPKSGPGKCYAKCLIPAQYEVITEKFPVYKGNNLDDNPSIEEMNLVIRLPRKEWVKKRADRNCLSTNPDDCLVWCLESVAGKTTNLIVVKDQEAESDFEWQEVIVEENMIKMKTTEFREVICGKRVTSDFIEQVQYALIEKGFYKDELASKMSAKVKEALIEFQKSNQLPIGQLDFETLTALGIAY